MTATCFTRYETDPFQRQYFEQYTANRGDAMPCCGAEATCYFAPHGETVRP